MMSTPDLLPTTILMAGGCLFLLTALRVGQSRWWGPVATLVLAAAAWGLADITITSPADSTTSAAAPVILDRFGFSVQLLCVVCGFFFVFVLLKSQRHNPSAGAVYGMLLLSLAGAMLAGVANDLVLMAVAGVLATLPIALAMQLTSDGAEAREAGWNSLLLGMLAATLLLLGFAILYGLAGTTNLTEIADTFRKSYVPDSTQQDASTGSRLGIAGMVLILAASLMWLSAAPFHFGMPEILDQSSPSLAGFASVVPKTVGLVIIARVALNSMIGFSETGMLVVAVAAGATLVLSGVMTMFQTSLRRTLSYVAVGQVGFVLMGLAVAFWSAGPALAHSEGRGLTDGMAAAVFQFLVSSTSLSVVYGVLTYLQRNERRTEFDDDLKGLLRSEPAAAVSLTIAFLSLVGVPPFPGFWSRLLLFLSTLSVEAEVTGSAVPGPHSAFVVLTALAGGSILFTSAALLRMIAAMCFDVPLGRSNSSGGRGALVAAIGASILLVIAGIYPKACLAVVELFLLR